MTCHESSISAIANFSSNEVGIRSHSISKMYLPNLGTEQVATGIEDLNNQTSAGTLSAYPNPAVGNINFTFELPESSNVTVSVYDEVGQKVTNILQENYDGEKDVHHIDLSTYSTGIYFLTLNFTSTKDGQSHAITKKFQVIKIS